MRHACRLRMRHGKRGRGHACATRGARPFRADTGRGAGLSQAGKRRQGLRRATAVALALAAHAGVLALLAWTTPALRLPSVEWPADVTVELSPRTPQAPSPIAAPASAPSHAARAQPVVSPSERRRDAPLPARLPRPSPAAPSAPAPPVSRPPSSQAGSAGPAGPGPPSPNPGPSPQERTGGDPRGAVRAAIGCSHEDFLRLNAVERDACQRKLADQPRGAGPKLDLIDPLKRAGYDRQAAADARRRGHDGPMSAPVVACSGPGSNFGTGCLPPEAMHSTRGGATPRPPAPDVVQPETPAP